MNSGYRRFSNRKHWLSPLVGKIKDFRRACVSSSGLTTESFVYLYTGFNNSVMLGSLFIPTEKYVLSDAHITRHAGDFAA